MSPKGNNCYKEIESTVESDSGEDVEVKGIRLIRLKIYDGRESKLTGVKDVPEIKKNPVLVRQLEEKGLNFST